MASQIQSNRSVLVYPFPHGNCAVEQTDQVAPSALYSNRGGRPYDATQARGTHPAPSGRPLNDVASHD
jgi:hypothetical protein